MVLDRKNQRVYTATTESDLLTLHTWASTQGLENIGLGELVDPFPIYVITRSSAERWTSGLHSLVYSDKGRRFASKYHLTEFAQLPKLFARIPESRNELLDFADLPAGECVSTAEAAPFFTAAGFETTPTFDAITPTEQAEHLSSTPGILFTRPTDSKIFIAYINVESSTKRKQQMKKGLDRVGWRARRITATTPFTFHLHANIDSYPSLARPRQIEYALSVSHLRALEEFVDSGSAWGLILEDDIDFDAINAWSFTLQELPSWMPSDCGIVQLAMIWPIVQVRNNNIELNTPDTLHLRSHVPGRDWGAAAYFLRREYAQAILEKMSPRQNQFDFAGYPGQPVSDVWLYDNTYFTPTLRVYSTPLMYVHAEESQMERASNVQDLMHKASRIFTQKMMADVGGKIKKEHVVGNLSSFTPTDYPFVSIITPTYNRRHLLPILEKCIHQQTYPRCRMEWIIVDDSQDGQPAFQPRRELGLVTKYVVLDEKIALGAKRNYTLAQAKGEICVYMDDDDFYPPTRVQLAVETFQRRPDAQFAGSSILPIYYFDTNELWIAGPWSSNHTTAGALAHRRIVCETQKYEATAAYAEEPSFLAGYKLPIAQMNHWQTMVCFAHGSNTYDKKKVLGTNKVKLSEQPISTVIHDNILSVYRDIHKSKSSK